jgi:hypothetical protein
MARTADPHVRILVGHHEDRGSEFERGVGDASVAGIQTESLAGAQDRTVELDGVGGAVDTQVGKGLPGPLMRLVPGPRPGDFRLEPDPFE